MITTETQPRGGSHRDDGHEEEILQADSEAKKKVTNNDGQHQRDSDQKEQVPDREHG